MKNRHGFEKVRDQEIPELNTHATIWHHLKTGAELLSLQNDDENKVFGIVFRTPPPDSTGLSHILEHSVLAGSEKYPVKEPFIQLRKGSLSTFLNAMTSPDKTSYPVASQNVKDLYNLIDVYLDAVFHPLLSRHTFQQEGWHYELDPDGGPLTYKGVVYNEMKGAYSSPDSMLYRYSMRSLFPDTPYGLDSGGDPAEIPNLTYEAFVSFHETYYHPSNARIFFYGDDDPEERLRYLNQHLQEFERKPIESSIPLQPHFQGPQRLVIPYAASDQPSSDGGGSTPGAKGFVTVNWILDENTDPETALALDILEHILVGTPASPLRKALIDSGLGEDLAGAGMSTLRQTYFSTGLKGIAVEDADQVEGLILDTLAALSKEGIAREMVEASLNTIEFQLRENNTGSYPRGLVLMFRSLNTWLYDGDPLAPLAFEDPLQAVKGHASADERYFEQFIRTCFLDNAHRTTVVLEPDAGLAKEQEIAERQALAKARTQMSEAQLEDIGQNTLELKRLQETPDPPEALATIPTLTLADLDRESKVIPLEILREGPARVLYHDLFTNGILYLDVGFDVHVLPQKLLPFVPLFGQALVKMGTETEDFVRLSQRIGRKTGGISPSTFISAVQDQPVSTAWLFFRGKATPDQADELLDILRDVLLEVRLDNQERFRQLVLESKARMEGSLVPGGHSIVNTRLGAHLHESGWASEQCGGVSALFFLRQLADDVEERWPFVLDKLEQLRTALIVRDAMLCNVTLDGGNWASFRPRLGGFISAMPHGSSDPSTWHTQYPDPNEGLTAPSRVNYVGKAANLYEHGYELDGSISVITNYLRTTWLWERVRVRGGAYGGFCLFDQHSGVFTFLSYRDPNLLDTLATYDRTGQFLRELELSQDELVKGIIGAIGSIDAYRLPDAKGYVSMIRHLVGLTDERRQSYREQVLSTTAADFRAFAEVLDGVARSGHVVVLGSQEAIDAANAAREGWLTVTKVL